MNAALGASLGNVLLAVGIILLVARLASAAFRRFRQPAVIGEVFAGIVLGPSLLGHLAPEVMRGICSPPVLSGLSSVAGIGLVFYMFLVGLEIDLGSISRQVRSAVGISHASILIPALLGGALALYLFPHFAPAGVRFLPFALFIALAMSITAFPILARILRDLGMSKSRLGSIAVACAAADDVTAWILLAVVVAVSQATGSRLALTVLATAGFVAVMFFVVRPLLARWLPGATSKEDPSVALGKLAVLVLAAAIAAEQIGIHALFGAFCVGACVPRSTRWVPIIEERLSGLLHAVMLPVFFALSGIRTQIGLVSSAREWLVLGVVIALACAGKLGGTLIAGRLSGMSYRDASSVGILMNTRGLMELIVLNVALDLGIITPSLFTIFVLMALFTTFMAVPIFRAINRFPVSPKVSEAAVAGAPP